MKDVKYCLESFAFYDHVTIQEKLQAKAQEGWLVEKAGNFLWKYRRIEPKELHIAVIYVPNASEFDPVETEEQQMMEEFAKKDGWNLACRWGQMHIFYNEEKAPTPMETDTVTQVETIHRAMKKGMLPAYLFSFLLCIYELVCMIGEAKANPVKFFSTPHSLYSIPAYNLLLVATMIELTFYFLWYKKAKKLAKETGDFLGIHLNHKISFVFIALSILLILISFVSSGGTVVVAMIIWIMAMIINIAIVHTMKHWMKKQGIPRGINRFLSVFVSIVCVLSFLAIMVFLVVKYEIGDTRKVVGTYELYGRIHNIYNDPLPLEMEDIMEIDAQYSKEANGTQTIFVSQMEYKQDAIPVEGKSIPEFSYTITEIKVPFLYEVCKQSLLRERQDKIGDDYIFNNHYVPMDTTIWRAKEAYQLHWSSHMLDVYLICWEDKIVEIEFDWQVTEEEIKKVVEILEKN